jgi:hypothetical protein
MTLLNFILLKQGGKNVIYIRKAFVFLFTKIYSVPGVERGKHTVAGDL